MKVNDLMADLRAQDEFNNESLVFIQMDDKTFAEIDKIYTDKFDRLIIVPVKESNFLCSKEVF